MIIRFHTVAGRKTHSRFIDVIRERLEQHYAVWEIMDESHAVEVDVIVDTRNASVYECHCSVLHRGEVFHDDFVFLETTHGKRLLYSNGFGYGGVTHVSV